MWQSLCITEKGGRNWGQPQVSRPPWSAEPGVAPLYLTRFTWSPWHSPCPSSTSFTSCSPFLCSLCSCFSPTHKKKKKKISLFCILICISFAFRVYILLFARMFCGGTTAPQERFCGALSPTRTILWSVITHKNDFCERQPCPTRTTNSRTADLIFTNSHIILPSVWFVCCNVFQEHRKEGVGSTQERDRVELKPIKLASLVHPHAKLHSSR